MHVHGLTRRHPRTSPVDFHIRADRRELPVQHVATERALNHQRGPLRPHIPAVLPLQQLDLLVDQILRQFIAALVSRPLRQFAV